VTVTRDGHAEAGRVDMRVIDVELGLDEVVVVWETTLEAPGLPSASSFESRVRCGHDSVSGLVGAEEPWFGASLPGVTLENRWRWPVDLQEGAVFGGTARFALPGGVEAPLISMTRSHRVELHEDVATPAGRFGTWRVAYEDETVTPEGTQRTAGTLWVARSVGLVQSVTLSDGSETRWRLDVLESP
jgi:hypothetical protein